tara:strand:- start:15 stop:611 length:597 start_codon:yes stop_codon:yes gene_type:complete
MAFKSKRLILFASGSGTNVQNICEYFQGEDNVDIVLVAGNNKQAQVWDRIKPFHIEGYCFDKKALINGKVLSNLRQYAPDLIILAGFLLKIPEALVEAFPQQIINIHPSLLPKYGGKGMYGMHVHQAVKENRETMSGISIHYVNQFYDEGQLLFQASVAIKSQDSAGDIAHKVQQLEYEHYPKVIKKLLFDSKMIDEK